MENKDSDLFSCDACQELLILVFALLICDTAGCLASRLAGCLALAATTVLSALAEITCFNCLDMFHESVPLSYKLLKILADSASSVNISASWYNLHMRPVAPLI